MALAEIKPWPTKVSAYVRRIRNEAKRTYAIQYADYLIGLRAVEPEAKCSMMAAQAVRMNLYEILSSD